MKRWYEELFENYAETYDKEAFTQGTVAEVDFIEKEIGSDRSRRILDIGCGTGRHAIELARRGYRVTGIDLSRGQINRARQKAAAAGVKVEFRILDARALRYKSEFELVVMLCEGGFPLMETDEMNYRILANAARALKPGGKLIFTTLSALYPLKRSVEEMHTRDGHFDLLTFRFASTIEFTDGTGNSKNLRCDERYYAPSEISWYLKTLGLGQIGIFGCDTGRFDRGITLTPEHLELLAVAEKGGGQVNGDTCQKNGSGI